jgi:hypothetical protein
MQHSVKEIAKMYSDLSERRKDKKRFIESEFIDFARQNHKKYSIVDNGDDMLVSTWYSNDLIEDYRKTILPREN